MQRQTPATGPRDQIGLGKIPILIALIIGLSMDIYDFFTELGPGVIISKKSFDIKYLLRKGKGFSKLIFAVHDLIQIAAMTILIPLFLSWLGLGQRDRWRARRATRVMM